MSDMEAIPDEKGEAKVQTLTIRDKLEQALDAQEARVLGEVAEVLTELTAPQRDKPVPVPADVPAERRPSGITDVRLASDPLYRSLPEWEQQIRDAGVDRKLQTWIVAVHLRQFEKANRIGRELNDEFVNRNGGFDRDYLIGTPDPDSGYGDGTVSPFVPLPLANLIVMHRDSRARLPQQAQRFTSAGTTIRVPNAGKATVEMVGEGATASDGSPTLDDKLLSKKKMQGKFESSVESLEDSAFNLVTFFGQRAGTAMGAFMDQQICTSTGIAPQITESFNSATLTAVTLANAGYLDYVDLVNMFFGIEEAYHMDLAWYANSAVLSVASRIVDGSGRPILGPGLATPNVVTDSISQGAIGSIFGRPVYLVPTQAGSLYLGDMSQYGYLDGGGLRVSSSEHAKFEQDKILWKITQRWDGRFIGDDGAGAIPGWIEATGITVPGAPAGP